MICPTAPIKTLPVNASSPTEREKLAEAERNDEDYPYWGWCTMDDDKQEMRGLDKSVEFLKNFMETEVQVTCRVYADGGTFCWDIRILSRSCDGCVYGIDSRKEGRVEDVPGNQSSSIGLFHRRLWISLEISSI